MFYNEPTKKDLLKKSERSTTPLAKKKNNDFFGASRDETKSPVAFGLLLKLYS